MSVFSELADRVWSYAGTPAGAISAAASGSLPPNVVVVGGSSGWLLVDLPADAVVSDAWWDSVPAVGDCLGLIGTSGPRLTPDAFAAFRRRWPQAPVHLHDRAIGPAPADPSLRTFSSVQVIDLGERQVELLHPGRARTEGDAIVNIPDAGVLLIGDLLPSGPADHASYSDSQGFPTDWPAALDLALTLITPDTVVVPGHGAPVGRRDVEDARDSMVIASSPEAASGPLAGGRTRLPLA